MFSIGCNSYREKQVFLLIISDKEKLKRRETFDLQAKFEER